MPICIECRNPVKALYTTYSKADDRALGKGVRLTQCPRCKRFADKYVEHDFVVLFIDMVLIKPQVYRHLLFNRLGRDDNKFDPSIIRLGILLLLFDVYLTWARIEKASLPPLLSSSPAGVGNVIGEGDAGGAGTAVGMAASQQQQQQQNSLLTTAPLLAQYLFFLFLVTTSTLAFHMPIRLLCSLSAKATTTTTTTTSGSAATTHAPTPPPPSQATATQIQTRVLPPTSASSQASTNSSLEPSPTTPVPPQDTAIPSSTTTTTTTSNFPSPSPLSQEPSILHFLHTILLPTHPASPTAISTALFVSSCTKLFPILLIVWDYDLPSSSTAISYAVIVNNIAALEILMDCGYARAGLLVAVGTACRRGCMGLVLGAVGLGGRGWWV